MSQFPHPPRKLLWPVYHAVSTFEYTDFARARQILDTILAEGLDNYTAPPDLWHNLSMVAARVLHQEAELALVQAGLREWPDNIDLLCDELQLRHTSHYDPTRAQEIWNQLYAMDRIKTAPYWRFWVYGAIYHATELNDRKTALNLLDEGLQHVRRDSLMDILRNYRRILVDSAPETPLKDLEEVKEYQRQVVETLEQRYQLGIELGVENAYVLAFELSRLYQERAGQIPNIEASEPNVAEDTSAQTGKDYYLDRAWGYLDLAERLYTGNPNHPIWDIYEARIRILMAQRRYGEALKFLSSLPQSRLNRDPSLYSVLRLASLMTGEEAPELVNVASQDGMIQVLGKLLDNDGYPLTQIARENPTIQATLKRVVNRLEQGTDEKPVTLEKALEIVVPYLFGNEGEGLLSLSQQNPPLRDILLAVVRKLEQ